MNHRNKTVVIFESKYGYTKRYAQWLSEALACPLFERKRFRPQDFEKYEVILYGGGLYAGGVSGIKLLTQHWNLLSDKKVILFTCGLADPADPANAAHIREALAKALPAEMMNSINLFHLRGGIDYSRLSLIHKTMMSMLRRMLMKKGDSELNSEARQILATYGQKIDFTDRASLQPVIDYCLQ